MKRKYMFGIDFYYAIEKLLPDNKEKLVLAKLHDGRIFGLETTFYSSIPDECLSDQVNPDLACKLCNDRGSVNLDKLHKSLQEVKKLEHQNYDGMRALCLLYNNDDIPMSQEDDDDYYPDVFPVQKVIAEEDCITLLCNNPSCLFEYPYSTNYMEIRKMCNANNTTNCLRGDQLLQTIENLLPDNKDRIVRIKLKNMDQTLRIEHAFFSIENPSQLDQALPYIACYGSSFIGREYVTVERLYLSLKEIEKSEPSFGSMMAVYLLFEHDIKYMDAPFEVTDHFLSEPEDLEWLKWETKGRHSYYNDFILEKDALPIQTIIEEEGAIVLVCDELSALFHGIKSNQYEIPKENEDLPW